MGLFARAQKIGPLPPIANPYPSRFQEFRRRISQYGALCVIALLLSTMFFPQYRERFSETSLDFVSVLISWAQAPVEFVQDTFHDTKSLATLKSEVATLQAKVRDLKQKAIQVKQIKFENEVLKAYLNVPKRPEITFHTAQVIATPQNGMVHSLLLELGSSDGVIKGQGVISEKGVVGRLNVVGEDTSRVRLLTDPNSRIPIYLPRLREKGILAGNGSLYPTLVYIHEVVDLKEGEEIVTSGSGSVFPYGIPVGKIDKITGGIVSVRLDSDSMRNFFLQVLEMNGPKSLFSEDHSGE